MLIFLMILGIITFGVDSQLPNITARFAAPIHQACQHATPLSLYSRDYEALVCGSHLQHDTLRTELTNAGLLHLLIVSGFHFVFLERVLRSLLARQTRTGWIIWPLLVVFVFANGCEPRIIRAFLSVAAARTSNFFQLRWNPAQTVTLAGFLALPFCEQSPTAIFGLITSWTAALAVSGFTHHFSGYFFGFPDGTFRESKTWWRLLLQSRLYLLLLPCLIRMTLPNPVSIFYNVILSPILGTVLFPASIAAYFLPGLVSYTDWLWKVLLIFLEQLAFLIPAPLAQNLNVPIFFLVAYLGILTVCAWLPVEAPDL